MTSGTTSPPEAAGDSHATSVGNRSFLPLALLLAARPKQWTKNALIFIAPVFSVNQYWQAGEPIRLADVAIVSGMAFIAFCLLSSSTYFLNDLLDVEKDRLHPKKRFRPIAAGVISQPLAIAAFVLLMAGGLALSLAVSPLLALLGAIYAGVMIAYSLHLKHIVLLDIFIIAGGFVLRAAAGAVAIQVPISPWLYICTILGALFIVVAKRRSEIATLAERAGDHRPILASYPMPFVDQMIAILATATVVAYSIYTFTAEGLPANHTMMLTIPFVLFGIFRYLYLVYVENEGGAPEDTLLKDGPLVIDIGLWLVVSASVLVIFRS